MLDDRNLKVDLFALFLLGAVGFLACSLATYDRADPVTELLPPFNRVYQPDRLVYPPHAEIQNACGKWGALAADLLLNAVGFGAIYLVGSLAALDLLLLMRRPLHAPWWRAIGWLSSLCGFTTIAALLAPHVTLGPLLGGGGALGLLSRTMLEQHFAFAGSLILSISLFLGGLMMATDYALIRLLSGATRVVGRGLAFAPSRLRRRSAESRTGKAARQSVEDATLVADELADAADALDEDELDEDELAEVEADVAGGLPVRVRGRQGAKATTGATAAAVSAPPAQAAAAPPVKRRAKQNSANAVSRPHFAQRKIDKQELSEVMHQLDAAASHDPGEFELPDLNLLIEGDEFCFDEQVQEVRRKAKILEKTFANFGFQVKVVEIETGPVIAQYEVELEAGLRLSKITSLADDLAIALRVPSVRIVAPLPGKNTVGIEVPNEARQVVRLREVIEETNGKAAKMKIPLFLGKDVSGKPLTVDLATLPHLLIAGRTGTGKSVCLNAIITSILMTKRPDEVRLLMIDPKMVELSGYARLPHLMHPVVTDMRKAEAILAWAVDKMEERYALLARAGVRHITSYNQLGDTELKRRLKPESDEEWSQIPNHLPFIVIVADEIADLMMTAGKEVEQHIIRLAQKSRAVGIHLILATQKPTVDVITGLIKSNLPARISFQVASRTDSRVVLDEMGADKLLGNGDMLFLWPGTSTLLRGQGTYLTDEEIEKIVECVSTDKQNFVHELVNLKVSEGATDDAAPGPLKKRDDLYEAAVDIVVREGRGSVSLLQRAMGIGYGRAARLIDYMAEDGIVGTYAGSQAREVLISLNHWEAMQRGETPPTEPKPPAALGGGASLPRGNPTVAAITPPALLPSNSRVKKRSNRITPTPDWDDDVLAAVEPDDDLAADERRGLRADRSGEFDDGRDEFEEEFDSAEDGFDEDDLDEDDLDEDDLDEDDLDEDDFEQFEAESA